MERREFSGSVIATTLANAVTSTDSSITLTDGSTFPSGNRGPFVISIDKLQPSEEKVLISSRSGNVLTVSQRGYDGTIGVKHSISAAVDHVLDATTLQDMNDTTYDNEIKIWMVI